MIGCLKFWMLGTCLLAAPPVGEPLERFEFLQIQMGVPFKVVLYAPHEAIANRAVRAAFRRIKQLNRIFSDYAPDSELMQFCRISGPEKPVEVSSELYFVLSRSLALSRQSGGAFDVSVGPVVKLWRKARRRKRLPNPEALAVARRLMGFQSIRLNAKAGTVQLMKPGMRLDFGGIAKGYAADEALRILRTHGITRALIDGGGDIVVGDAPPGKAGWRIGIAALAKPDAEPNRFLLLKNAAVATSGDAYQAVTIDGTRYSHIVDPKTGLGLTRSSSVTVVAADGITADSLASAVSVLGPQRGLKLIESTKAASALIVELKDGRLQTTTSACFAKHEPGKE